MSHPLSASPRKSSSDRGNLGRKEIYFVLHTVVLHIEDLKLFEFLIFVFPPVCKASCPNSWMLRLFGTSCARIAPQPELTSIPSVPRSWSTEILSAFASFSAASKRGREVPHSYLCMVRGNTGNLCKLLLRHIIFFSQLFNLSLNFIINSSIRFLFLATRHFFSPFLIDTTLVSCYNLNHNNDTYVVFIWYNTTLWFVKRFRRISTK